MAFRKLLKIAIPMDKEMRMRFQEGNCRATIRGPTGWGVVKDFR